MKRNKADSPSGPRLVRVKEMDTLKHLVRKYPDVALDTLLLKDLCLEACKRGVAIVYNSTDVIPIRWEVPDYVTMTDIG